MMLIMEYERACHVRGYQDIWEAATGEGPRLLLTAAAGGFLNLSVCFRYQLWQYW